MATIDTNAVTTGYAGNLVHSEMHEASQVLTTLFSTTTTQIITQDVITYVTSSITYVKRGLLASGLFEYWRTNVRDDGPPSGNTVFDVQVIGDIRG
jgi:hypothetical protein